MDPSSKQHSVTMQQTALEVTDRLYNKKQIQKLRNKSSLNQNKDHSGKAERRIGKAGKKDHRSEVMSPKVIPGNEYI